VPELRFTKDHEWALIKDGIVIVGISDFAQEQLGDIVSIELPKVGSIFEQMHALAIIDSVKASSDIYAPIGGEVVEVNEELTEKPEMINQSPYELGWIMKIRPSNMSEIENLMTKEQYERYVGEIE
jgi:glycine cleavage system H protein